MYDPHPRPPIFEVVTPASGAAARRLTTATKVQDALGIGAVNTTLIETYIDFVSAQVVRYCGLARDVAGTVPTFGAEAVKATWLVAREDRGTRLILPWRAPITALAVVENDITLTANTEYRLLPGNMVERVVDDLPICWYYTKIVATYTAGWTLPGSVPAEIEGYVIDQVKMQYQNRAFNQMIKSEQVPDVYMASYNTAGGLASTNIGASGLLVVLESALSAFKAWNAS